MNVVHEIAVKPRGGIEDPRFEDMKKGPPDESRGRISEAPHPGTIHTGILFYNKVHSLWLIFIFYNQN